LNQTLKNFKIVALILLISTLLVLATNSACVKAQTQPTVYVYNSQGGTISANGTQLIGGTVYNYTNGDTVSYTTTPGSGFAFLCFDWISGSTPTTSTDATLTETLTSNSCAIQALFVPTANATVTPSGSGAATVVTLISAGGTTSPSSGQSYTNYTIGTVSNFEATADSGFKFLYWLVVSSLGSTYYTSSALALNIPAGTIALQAFFVPTSSTVVINEYSNAAAVILVAILAIITIGTYAYTRKTKK
jgi:hypothetical protein